MNSKALATIGLLLGFNVAHAVPIVIESFETDGEGVRYTTNSFDTGFSSGIFQRVTGQPVQFVDPLTGQDGSWYFATDQTSSAFNPISPFTAGYIKLSDLNVTDLMDLEVTVSLARSNDNNDPSGNWETADFFEIQYAFDSDIGATLDTGNYTTIGRFIGLGLSNLDNGDLIQDADLDGIQDVGGAGLTTQFTPFAFSIPDTGTLLSVRIVVESGGNEELGIDRIEVAHTPSVTVPEPATLALLGISLFGMGLARRKV